MVTQMPLFTIMLCLLLASTMSAMAEEPSRLVPGTVLAPDLLPPGWIAVHLQDYVNNRLAYAEPCRTDAVVDELQRLSKQVGHDQELSNTARARLQYAVVEGDSNAKRHTDIAIDALALLDKDIATIDGLSVRLSSLPDCDNATTASRAQVSGPREPPPSQTAAGSQATPSPEPPLTVALAEPAVAASPAARSDDTGPPATGGNVFVVRFDDKLTGLTPTSIRILGAALKALGAGHKVQIAIEGCDESDGVPEGAGCVERTRRLKRILSDDGVSHPADLIARSH
jgi:hypothetical protein